MPACASPSPSLAISYYLRIPDRKLKAHLEVLCQVNNKATVLGVNLRKY